jgi:hypothetical protein
MASDKFTESIPEIPSGLISACRQGDLIIFVGAGVSRQLGSPSWDQLADMTLQELHTNGHLTFSESKQLSNLDARKKLSLAEIVAKRTSHTFDYDKLIHSSRRETQDISICQDLVSIGVPIVTTNYDEWLDRELEKKIRSTLSPEKEAQTSDRPNVSIYYRPEDLTVDKLFEVGSIIHFHGSVRDRGSMVITSSDYFRHYSLPEVREFLSTLFERFILLFVGYGLEEAEILEFIFGKAHKKKEPVAYWLYPCCTFENELTGHMRHYYQNLCNIEVIPYYIDQVGHVRLAKVIQHWAPRLAKERGDPLFLKEAAIFDEALK